jgi:hypothetical protein
MLTRFARRPQVPVGPRAVHAPRRGTFQQGVCVLLEAAPTVAAVTKLLTGDFEVLRVSEPSASSQSSWEFGGPWALLDYRSELNGLVQVDVVDRAWPDGMGERDSTLFGAWALGHFGPCTYPGALERAVANAWTWPAARTLAPRHAAFLRVRLSYLFGAAPQALIKPEGADPLDELRFATQVQLALMALPGALAAFNPNGELLLSAELLRQRLERDRRGEATAVDAWANVRRYRPAEGWLLFDTVGLGQLDLTDHQAILPFGHPSAQEVPGLLHSMADYDVERGGVLGPGDTSTDLAGQDWVAHGEGEARVDPPRPVLRWRPEGVEVPEALLGTDPPPSP